MWYYIEKSIQNNCFALLLENGFLPKLNSMSHLRLYARTTNSTVLVMHYSHLLIFMMTKLFLLLYCFLTDIFSPNSHRHRKEVGIFSLLATRCFIAELNGTTLIQRERGQWDWESSPSISTFIAFEDAKT